MDNDKSPVDESPVQVPDEQWEFYRRLPIEERLRWLEEAQEFMYKILPREKWELLQKFRRGEM